MNFNETTVKKQYLYNGKIVNLRKDDVLLPDGKPAIREVVEHSGGSAIICLIDDKILLVRQFRYPYGEVIWEIPAGKVNAGEDPEQTAIRELKEECGYVAEKTEKLFEVYPSPGYTSERISIYRAVSIKKSTSSPDEGEFVQGKWFKAQEVMEMIKNGEIKDGKTIIAVLSVLK